MQNKWNEMKWNACGSFSFNISAFDSAAVVCKCFRTLRNSDGSQCVSAHSGEVVRAHTEHYTSRSLIPGPGNGSCALYSLPWQTRDWGPRLVVKIRYGKSSRVDPRVSRETWELFLCANGDTSSVASFLLWGGGGCKTPKLYREKKIMYGAINVSILTKHSHNCKKIYEYASQRSERS